MALTLDPAIFPPFLFQHRAYPNEPSSSGKPHKLNLRYAWADAEIFVYAKLVSTADLAQILSDVVEVISLKADADKIDYTYRFLQAAGHIAMSLILGGYDEGQFEGEEEERNQAKLALMWKIGRAGSTYNEFDAYEALDGESQRLYESKIDQIMGGILKL